METKVFKGDGGLSLVADVGGDPADPAVVLLHGGGQTRHSWIEAARALTLAGRYVVSLDLRGHGESDWAPDGDYSLQAFAPTCARCCANCRAARPTPSRCRHSSAPRSAASRR